MLRQLVSRGRHSHHGHDLWHFAASLVRYGEYNNSSFTSWSHYTSLKCIIIDNGWSVAHSAPRKIGTTCLWNRSLKLVWFYFGKSLERIKCEIATTLHWGRCVHLLCEVVRSLQITLVNSSRPMYVSENIGSDNIGSNNGLSLVRT